MTVVERVRVRDVLRLERREVPIEPITEYSLIGIYSFGRGIFHRSPMTGVELGDYRFFGIEPGDLVLSNIQAWEGAIAKAGASDSGTIGTHRFLTYVPRAGEIDTSWARWFFLSEPGLRLIRRAAPGTAVRNRTLAIKRFEDLVIPLPSVEEQRRVAATLDALSLRVRDLDQLAKRTSSRTLLALLPALADRRLQAEDHVRTRLGDLAEIVTDTVHPGDDPAPASDFIGLQHVEPHTGQKIGSEAIEEFKGRKLRFAPGDIVYGYLRPYLNKVWVADRHGLCSVDQYVLRTKPQIRSELLATALRSQSTLDQANALTHSLQLPRLRSGLLLDMLVPWPTAADQTLLIESLDDLTRAFVRLARTRDRQAAAVKALIPAALNRAFGDLEA